MLEAPYLGGRVRSPMRSAGGNHLRHEGRLTLPAPGGRGRRGGGGLVLDPQHMKIVDVARVEGRLAVCEVEPAPKHLCYFSWGNTNFIPALCKGKSMANTVSIALETIDTLWNRISSSIDFKSIESDDLY